MAISKSDAFLIALIAIFVLAGVGVLVALLKVLRETNAPSSPSDEANSSSSAHPSSSDSPPGSNAPTSLGPPSVVPGKTVFSLAATGALCVEGDSCSTDKQCNVLVNGLPTAWITGGSSPTAFLSDGVGVQPVSRRQVPLSVLNLSSQPPVAGWLAIVSLAWGQETGKAARVYPSGVGIFQSTADNLFNEVMGKFVVGSIDNRKSDVDDGHGVLMAFLFVSYGDVSGVWNSSALAAFATGLGVSFPKIPKNYPVAVALLPDSTMTTASLQGDLQKFTVPSHNTLQGLVTNPSAV